MSHTIRCAFASSPKERCKCSCNGKLHGSGRTLDTFYEDNPHETTITLDMGGEIADFIRLTKGRTTQCSCLKKLHINEYLGYEHEGGIADKNGKKWWVYIRCEHCSYDWSYWKIEQRINRQIHLEKKKNTQPAETPGEQSTLEQEEEEEWL